MFLDVHEPWHHVKVTDQRTALDFAACMRDLADVHYPAAELIRVVDNLSTHVPAALRGLPRRGSSPHSAAPRAGRLNSSDPLCPGTSLVGGGLIAGESLFVLWIGLKSLYERGVLVKIFGG